MVYAADSKSAARKGLRVQVSSPALSGILQELAPTAPWIGAADGRSRVLSGSYCLGFCDEGENFRGR